MGSIISLIKPLIFQAINSRQVKELVVQLLEKYAEKTDNDVDDVIVKMVRDALLGKDA
jgi:hypothetical protein